MAAARGESAHGGATPYGTVAPTQAQLADIVGKKWADVRDKYAIGKVIGEGSFGKVHMCTEVATGVERVVKVRAGRPTWGEARQTEDKNQSGNGGHFAPHMRPCGAMWWRGEGGRGTHAVRKSADTACWLARCAPLPVEPACVSTIELARRLPYPASNPAAPVPALLQHA